MEVSRHCEEKQYNESREQLEARKQKRRELQEKFAKERKERRREKERIKMEEGRGRRYESMMKKKTKKNEVDTNVSAEDKETQLRRTEIWKEKWKEQEENIKKWKMLQKGDSNGVVEKGEIVEGSQKEVEESSEEGIQNSA